MPTRVVWNPAAVLLVLAPIIAEVLPGATPPIVFLLNPAIAVWETLLYGCGALLVRQLARHWGGGWWTILALGAAYGLIEEGLSLKVIFDPAFEPAGALATYGRVGEIATVFVAQLLVYHSLVSITIPILLTELMFRKERDRQWLSGRAIMVVTGLWVLALVYGYAVVHPAPPPPTYVLVIPAVAGLAVLAWRLRHLRPPPRDTPRRRWIALFAVGLTGTVVFLITSWSGPEADRPPFASLVAQTLVVVALTWVVNRIGGHRGFADRDHLALASGVLAMFIVADVFKPAGEPVLAVVASVALLALGRRLRPPADRASSPTA